MTKVKKGIRIFLIIIVSLLLAGFLIPERLVIPVRNATEGDWNRDTFWHEPWGRSGVHKGIDIFAGKGTDMISATDGFVIYKGRVGIGGNILVIFGPKWRIHYYAHLESSIVNKGDFVFSEQKIGTVGDSGNAKGKSPHLHYSVITLFPYIWRWDTGTQGWRKIFYLDSGEMLMDSKR